MTSPSPPPSSEPPSSEPLGPTRLQTPSSSADAPALDAEVVSALQAALAAEHAAVWVYGLLNARMPAEFASALGAAVNAHRAGRDGVERLLSQGGIEPVPTEPAYALPEPLTDEGAGARLAVTTEEDCANAWYAVLAFTDTGDRVRRTALDGLTGAAVRATSWRVEAGVTPATLPFPGAPAR